ncbi:hypothetical protein [Mycobacterium canetti]|uniref:hypothetical protein n=1 Tax=Mycobacterium canetti TaxID=78331 RepID=UPI001E366012|nr:hypothetical protein [Mycobacterium canetti]
MSEVKQYVREALHALPGAGAVDVAAAAAEQVPAGRLRVCLAEALVDMARLLAAQSRRDALDNSLSNDSPKVRDRASWWAQMLTERVHVNGLWMALGDCTFDDLQACIDERERLISRVSGQIENYKRLQKLMIQHKAQRVCDVPAQTEWADQ